MEEEIRLLLRSIRDKHFSFVLVQYNHKSAVQLVKDRIAITYPNRPTLNIITDGIDYRRFMDSIYQQYEGIIYIEDFDHLLKNPELYQGFNMRRDKISDQPIALIGFMLKGKVNITRAMENIADMWSMRSLVAEIDVPVPEQNFQFITPEFRKTSTLGGANMEDKEAELERLKKRLERLDYKRTNIEMRFNLFSQILTLYQDIGSYKEGLKYIKNFSEYFESLKIDREDEIRHDLGIIYIHNMLMAFHRHLGDYESAISSGEKVYDTALKYGYPGAVTIWYQINLAKLYEDLGRFEDAKKTLETALKKSENLYQGEFDNPIKSNLGLIYNNLGKYKHAKNILESLLESNSNVGEDSLMLSKIKSNLAVSYMHLREYEKAKDLLEFSLKSIIKKFGENHIETAMALVNLGYAHSYLGDYKTAIDMLSSALKINISEFGENHIFIANNKSNLANMYNHIKRYDKAKNMIQSALEIATSTVGEYHPRVALIYYNYAGIYYEQKKWDKALELYKKAYQISFRTLGEKHPQTISNYNIIQKTIQQKLTPIQ